MFLSPAQLSSLERFQIESRRRFLGAKAGSHRSLKRGHGIEFSDYRQYEPGDNPRLIDWRVFGRTERLYIKQYQEEQDLRLSIVVDSSASMGPDLHSPKWALTKTVALSLAYLGIMQQDMVRIGTALDAKSPFLRGSTALRHFDGALDKAIPQKSTSLLDLLKLQIASLKSPGIVLLLSDFFYELPEVETALRFIRSRNMDGACIALLAQADVSPLATDQGAWLEDSETAEQRSILFDAETKRVYTKRLTQHLTSVRDLCRQNDMGFALIREGDNLIESFMNQKQGLRILRV